MDTKESLKQEGLDVPESRMIDRLKGLVVRGSLESWVMWRASCAVQALRIRGNDGTDALDMHGDLGEDEKNLALLLLRQLEVVLFRLGADWDVGGPPDLDKAWAEFQGQAEALGKLLGAPSTGTELDGLRQVRARQALEWMTSWVAQLWDEVLASRKLKGHAEEAASKWQAALSRALKAEQDLARERAAREDDRHAYEEMKKERDDWKRRAIENEARAERAEADNAGLLRRLHESCPECHGAMRHVVTPPNGDGVTTKTPCSMLIHDVAREPHPGAALLDVATLLRQYQHRDEPTLSATLQRLLEERSKVAHMVDPTAHASLQRELEAERHMVLAHQHALKLANLETLRAERSLARAVGLLRQLDVALDFFSLQEDGSAADLYAQASAFLVPFKDVKMAPPERLAGQENPAAETSAALQSKLVSTWVRTAQRLARDRQRLLAFSRRTCRLLEVHRNAAHAASMAYTRAEGALQVIAGSTFTADALQDFTTRWLVEGVQTIARMGLGMDARSAYLTTLRTVAARVRYGDAPWLPSAGWMPSPFTSALLRAMDVVEILQEFGLGSLVYGAQLRLRPGREVCSECEGLGVVLYGSKECEPYAPTEFSVGACPKCCPCDGVLHAVPVREHAATESTGLWVGRGGL